MDIDGRQWRRASLLKHKKKKKLVWSILENAIECTKVYFCLPRHHHNSAIVMLIIIILNIIINVKFPWNKTICSCNKINEKLLLRGGGSVYYTPSPWLYQKVAAIERKKQRQAKHKKNTKKKETKKPKIKIIIQKVGKWATKRQRATTTNKLLCCSGGRNFSVHSIMYICSQYNNDASAMLC